MNRSLLLAGLGATLLAIVTTTFWLWPRDHWLADRRAEILSVQQELPHLYVSEDWVTMADKTHQLALMSEGRTSKDSTLTDALYDIREADEVATYKLSSLGLDDILEKEKDALQQSRQGNLTQALATIGSALRELKGKQVPEAIALPLRDRFQMHAREFQSAIDAVALAQAQKRAEEQRKVEAEAARQAAEARVAAMRQQQEELRKRQAAEEVRRNASRSIKATKDYIAMKAEADNIVRSLNTDLLGEDSAWRGISRRSSAAAHLLGIYVKLQGRHYGVDVDKEVDDALAENETAMIGEDSALRAIYKHDEAFMKILGLWCKLLDPETRGIYKNCLKIESDVLQSMISEDSAYRAQSIYARANMQILQLLAATRGDHEETQTIVADATTGSIGDDSAVRDAMRFTKASMELALLILEQSDSDSARQIRHASVMNTVSDDSAIRAHEEYKQGMVDVIRKLIDWP